VNLTTVAQTSACAEPLTRLPHRSECRTLWRTHSACRVPTLRDASGSTDGAPSRCRGSGIARHPDESGCGTYEYVRHNVELACEKAGALFMASRERPVQTLDSVQLTRSIQAGDTNTFLPGHQFRVATSMYRIAQPSSSTTKPARCPMSPSVASME
jgi:hypothetical protein